VFCSFSLPLLTHKHVCTSQQLQSCNTAMSIMTKFTLMLKCIVIDFFLINQQDALIIQIYSVINSTYFGHLLCPSSGVFYCTFGTGMFHALRFYPDSAWKGSSKTSMKLTSAECTVENS